MGSDERYKVIMDNKENVVELWQFSKHWKHVPADYLEYQEFLREIKAKGLKKEDFIEIIRLKTDKSA